jgi:hypothetical protein
MTATLTTGGPGSTMRANPGHLADLDRTETDAYVPVCRCGWVDLLSYGDIRIALAMCAVHMEHPEIVGAA